MGRKVKNVSSVLRRLSGILPINWKTVLVSVLLVCSLAEITGDGEIAKRDVDASIIVDGGCIYIIEPERTWRNEHMD